jgi:hypothetical protein
MPIEKEPPSVEELARELPDIDFEAPGAVRPRFARGRRVGL